MTRSRSARSDASASRTAGDSQSQLTSFGELPVFGFSGRARIGATSSERSAASERAKRRASASGWRRATPRRSRARSPGVQDPSDASRIGLREIGGGTPFLVQAPWSAGKYPSSGYALKTACTPLMLAATLKMPWLPGPSYMPRRIFTAASSFVLHSLSASSLSAHSKVLEKSPKTLRAPS